MPSRRKTSRPAPDEAAPDAPPSVARFASVVAHEIRNPLSAVKIALQTLERQGGVVGPHARRLDIALREVDTIETVLSRILEWARPHAPVPTRVAAAELARIAVSRCAMTEDDHPIALELGPGTSEVRALVDVESVTRALAEILRNAGQSSVPQAPVHLRVEQVGAVLRFVVRDGGSGFDDEAYQRAFEPFFTTRARGIGLGLPRARDVARAHGGDVRIARLPTGAEVTLELPADRSAP